MSVKLREKKLTDGRSHLYLDISRDGYRKKDYLKLYVFDNPKDSEERRHNKQARELARQYALDRERQLVQMQRGGLSASSMTLEQVFELHMQGIKKEGSRSNYLYMFQRAISLGLDSMSINTITRHHSELLMNELQKTLGPSTANERFVKFSAVMNFAVKQGFITSNPAIHIKKAKVAEKDISYLEEKEIRTVAAAAVEGVTMEVKRAFLFSCYTGLRVSDILQLDWSHIQGDRLSMVQKKTTDRVYIPLNETALRLAGDRNGEKVFSLSGINIDYHIKQLAIKAGLEKKISFHVARHTFATWLITRGVDIYTVQQLMGHKNINSTMRYAKVISEKKRQSVERLPDIF
ncbi:site-specific integrase [Limibacter armeniacum]|uniref:site-specific integrase n=1 Tax=Limibacter armeniacum TaxID=466084 RepID=UPI002FE568AB